MYGTYDEEILLRTGNLPDINGFPARRSVVASFDVRLNKVSNKQYSCQDTKNVLPGQAIAEMCPK